MFTGYRTYMTAAAMGLTEAAATLDLIADGTAKTVLNVLLALALLFLRAAIKNK